MPAPIKVDKDQVRMLVLAVGVREAARQMGLPETAVQQWSCRGKWLAKTRPTPAALPLPASMQSVTTVRQTPADALSAVLADDAKETRLSLSRSARNLAQQAETALLDQAGDVLSAAKVASVVHRWDADKQGPAVAVNIAILGQSDQELIRKV